MVSRLIPKISLTEARSSSTTNARKFLDSRGITERHLLDVVSKYYPLSSEPVVICGSVADGYANKQSDFDLIILGVPSFSSGNVIKLSETSDLLIHHGDIDKLGVVQIEKTNPTAFDDSLGRAKSIETLLQHFGRGRADVKALKISMLSSDEQRFMHRLFFGHPINGEADIDSLLSSNIQALQYATIFSAFNNYISAKNDVAGHLEEGDVHQSAHNLRKLSVFAAEIALSVLGETKVSERWILRDLRKYTENLGIDLVSKITKAIFSTPDDDVNKLFFDIESVVSSLIPTIDKEWPAASGFVKQYMNYTHAKGHV